MLGGFSSFDIAVVSVVFLIGFIFYTNKTQKTGGVWARMFFANGSSKDYPAIELFNENRIEVQIIQKKGGILNKVKDDTIPKSYEMDGVPSEHQINAGKRARVYYVTQTGTKTLGFNTMDTGAGDPVNQILNYIGGAVQRAQQAIHAEGRKGFLNRLPDVILGAAMMGSVLYFIRLIFPELNV